MKYRYRDQSEMKDSGVEWMHFTSRDWHIGSLKWYISIKSGDFISNEDLNEEHTIPVIGGNGIMAYTHKTNVNYSTMVIGRVGALCGNVHLITEPSWITDNALYLSKWNQKKLQIEYLFNVLKTLNLNQYANKTAQPLISSSLVKSKIIPIPSMDEQKRINEFLYKKTAAFDSLIEKKEKLIEKLEEAKKSLISEIVIGKVKILDGKLVPRDKSEMKDSGVEWIGEIPREWEVKRLKYLSDIKSSNVDKKSYDDEIPVSLCNYTDVYNNDYITDELDFMKATANLNEIIKFTLKAGDIILTKDSESPDDIANSAYVVKDLNGILCGYHLAVVSTNVEVIYSKYLFRLFNVEGVKNYFETQAKGITRFGLSIDSFRNLLIPVPSVEQQKEISRYVEERINAINQVIKRIKTQIQKLKEAKKSLIAEAVTGKIKVLDE